mgnify:CR=1 FL=1
MKLHLHTFDQGSHKNAQEIIYKSEILQKWTYL